jgi:hypothetical protein
MANFRSYDDRDRSRNIGLGVFAAAATIGAAAIALSQNTRNLLGRAVMSGIQHASEWAEEHTFGGAATDVRNGIFGRAQVGIFHRMEESTLGTAFKSFDRLVGNDLAKQNMRDMGIENLVQQGWSQEDAEFMFHESGLSHDILSGRSTEELLAHPYYREYVMSQVDPSHSASIPDLIAQVDTARETARQARGVFSNDAYMEANRLFAQHLAEESAKNGNANSFYNRITAAVGLENIRLGSLVRNGFMGEVSAAFLDPTVHAQTQNSAILGQESFMNFLAGRRGGGQLSSAEILAARSAFSLHLAGEEHWESVVNQLPTELIGSGNIAYSTLPIKNLASAGWNTLANEFTIPLAPGMGGLMPLKFFPWKRGNIQDFAGTFGMGTAQRELYEAMPEPLRSEMFNDQFRLKRDTHYIGNRLFGTTLQQNGQTTVIQTVSLPDEINNWRIKDARYGFMSEFARIRNHTAENAKRGVLRTWVGDNTAGRIMDFFGLDSQSDESKSSLLASKIGKWLWPNSDKYSRNPVNAMNRIRNGSNDVRDVEAIINAIHVSQRIPGNIDPSSIFTPSALNQSSLHPGLRKLINQNFSAGAMTRALQEIDAAENGETLVNHEYFTAQDAGLFRGPHTRMTARRFVQNDIGTLAQGIRRGGGSSTVDFGGLFGQKDADVGFSKLRNMFYDEVFAQLGASPNSDIIFQAIQQNVQSLQSVTEKERATAGAYIWSLISKENLHRNLTNQNNVASKLANELRAINSPIGTDIDRLVRSNYGGISSWNNPELENIEGIGARPYAVPNTESFWSATNRVFATRSFSPMTSFFTRESREGMGGSTSPGPMYHSMFRLNKMLSEYGLGLADKDLQTTWQGYGNLLLKRVLPVMVAGEVWKNINHDSKKLTGTSPDEAIGKARAGGALLGSFAADTLGLTPHLKALADLTPGLSDYWKPRSYKEMRNYLSSGYDPVRRGRWWLTGSRTAFIGDRVQYFSPSWYRINQSNWQSASNVDITSDAAQAHSLIPSLLHPLSTFRHFSDPYWWERKHAKDRPYVVSGEMFDPNTLLGNLGNMTIGRLLKPSKVLHPEYLGKFSSPSSGMITPEISNSIASFSQSGAYKLRGNLFSRGTDLPANAIAGEGSGQQGATYVYSKKRNKKFRRRKGKDLNPLDTVAGELRGGDLTSDGPDLGTAIPGTNVLLQGRRLGEQVWDILGIYGYGQRVAAEKLGIRKGVVATPVAESATRGYNMERQFWDKNLGGTVIPGVPVFTNLSESWRRVIPHRDRNIKDWNPVVNSVGKKYPWLPASDYFLDFSRGDPYTKISRGEIRLPGKAYEMVHKNNKYSPVTQVQILADVAPWSKEMQRSLQLAREDIANSAPKDAARKQKLVSEALKRASIQKKIYNLHNYRFNQPTEKRTYTVKRIIDANTILTKEDPNPIRLAGVRVSDERIRGYLKEQNKRIKGGDDAATALYAAFGLTPGKKFKAVMATKENGQISDDLYRTKRAAIFVRGENLNRRFIRNGLGIEQVNDNSAAGIIARYSRKDRLYGKGIEKLAHLDTPFNTKLWQVRSGLEEYKRSQVYGTTAGDWGAPVKTYVRPTMDALAAKNPVSATLGGAFIGSLFARSRKGKMIGAITGGAFGFEMSGRRVLKELITRKKYIPKRVQRRRDVEEYYDTLKYLKYTRLAQQYNEAAKDSGEGMDILKYADERKEEWEDLKNRLGVLQDKKRRILLSNEGDKRARKRRSHEINLEMQKALEDSTSKVEVGPNSARALLYRSLAERTLQGAKPGGPLNDSVGGLPKYERELAMDIIANGSHKEKEEFFSLLTRRQQAVLGSSLGISRKKIPEKEGLIDYFKTHQLPDASWEGWEENVDLNNLRVVTGAKEGITPIEMGVYPRNSMDSKAAVRDIPIPVIYGKTNDLERTLHTLLAGAGVKNISVQVQVDSSTDESRSDVSINLRQDRTEDVARKLR